MLKRSVITVLFFWWPTAVGAEEHKQETLAEFRGSTIRYRYAAFTHVFERGIGDLKLVSDNYYLGDKELDEANIGLGLRWKPRHSLTLIPVAYGVLGSRRQSGHDHKRPDGRERQLGFKHALLGAYEAERWKADWYLAHFLRLGGKVPNFLILDSGDFRRVFNKTWEAGVSAGFVRAEGAWNPEIGPVVRRNDQSGFWSVSYRFGGSRFGNEFRVNRAFLFK